MTLTSFGYSFWMSCISVMLKVIAWLYIACIPEGSYTLRLKPDSEGSANT